jgi:hypothetical protein
MRFIAAWGMSWSAIPSCQTPADVRTFSLAAAKMPSTWRRAYPKLPSARGDPSYLTIFSNGVLESRVDERQQLEDNLRDKSKYGKPALPFVIAALCNRNLVTDRLIQWALYGPEMLTVPVVGGVGQMNAASLTRNPRGLWQRGAELQITRVSAVLTAQHLGRPVLLHNSRTNAGGGGSHQRWCKRHTPRHEHEALNERSSRPPTQAGRSTPEPDTAKHERSRSSAHRPSPRSRSGLQHDLRLPHRWRAETARPIWCLCKGSSS